MKTATQTFSGSLEGNHPLIKQSIRVLLVGNNPNDLAQYSVLLTTHRSNNFLVETAFSREECLKKGSKTKPSIIILDDSIGFMEMTEISHKLQHDSRFSHIPVMIIKSSNYHSGPLSNNVCETTKDVILSGELPHKILGALQNNTTSQTSLGEEIPLSIDKRISKLLSSLF